MCMLFEKWRAVAIVLLVSLSIPPESAYPRPTDNKKTRQEGCGEQVARSTKDFSKINEAYRFFLGFSNETGRVQERVLSITQAHFGSGAPNEFLDFGAGGAPIAQFLFAQPHKVLTDKTVVSLVDPNKQARALAALDLLLLADDIGGEWDYMPENAGRQFDFILSNHAHQYVTDLDETNRRLLANASPGALVIVTMANEDNQIHMLSRQHYQTIDKPWPFQSVGDLEASFDRLGVSYQKSIVESQVDFADSVENRRKFLRFVHGNDYALFDESAIISDLNRYMPDEGWIKLGLADNVYAITVPEK